MNDIERRLSWLAEADLVDLAWAQIFDPRNAAGRWCREVWGTRPVLETLCTGGPQTALNVVSCRVCGATKAPTIAHQCFNDEGVVDDNQPSRGHLFKALERAGSLVQSIQPQRTREEMLRRQMWLITAEHPHWPRSFHDLGPDGPWCLWGRGNSALLDTVPLVAIVGSRHCTRYGRSIAQEWAGGLWRHGVAVVSGGAIGIDGHAHQGALTAGAPTVTVMAHGVDEYYPRSNAALLEQISETGAMISEYPLGCKPAPWRFLHRNRIIAALGRATVVVEAGWRSGALNTAGHAATMGRPLGAVPGSIHEPTSAGCHVALRDMGAVAVTAVEEVLEMMGPIGRTAAMADLGAGIVIDSRLRDVLCDSDIRVLDALQRGRVYSLRDIAHVLTGDLWEAQASVGRLVALGQLSVRDAQNGDQWCLK